MCNKLNYVNLLENSWSAIDLLFPTFPEMKQSFAEPGETPGVFLMSETPSWEQLSSVKTKW